MQLTKINNKDISIKEYMKQRVLTFKDIDKAHGRPNGTAGRAFRANRKHFIEGEDYFRLKSSNFQLDEIRRFGINSPNGAVVITESGYLMLAKSFTDELAWTVQRELVNYYFRNKTVSTKRASPQPTKGEQLTLETSEYFYFDKFYNGEPVLVPADIEHFTGIGRYCAEGCLKKYGKKKTDYLLLEGEELAKFKRENPKTSKMASAVFLIRKSGFVKLLKRYSCKVDMPKCFVEEKKAKPHDYCKENRNFITPNDVEKICEECCIAMSDGKRYIPADIAKRISYDAVGFLIASSRADDSLKNAVTIYENKVSGDTYRMECLTELGVRIAAQIHNVYLGGECVSSTTSLVAK